MSDEKIDKAKLAKDTFMHDLPMLRTADQYREFTIKFFYSQAEKERMLNIIGLAELTHRNFQTWPAFQQLYKTIAFREFSRKINVFITEEAKLGFML